MKAHSKKNRKGKNAQEDSFNTKINRFFTTYSNHIFAISMFFSVLVFYKLFDIRVNLAGDDSTFIMAGYQLLKEGVYPTWHSPLYSIFLALPIAIFGVSLSALKITSAVFLLSSYYFFYKAFKHKVKPALLILVVLITGINSYLAYYSTFTFSEAFFMFFQALFFYYAFRLLDYPDNKLKYYIILGLISVALYMAKTIGVVGILSLLAFFALKKDWKKLLYSAASFGVTYLVVRFLKRIIWGASGNQFSTQLTALMQKDPYNAALGKEDFVGFLTRLVGNSNLYISKHFFRFLGLRDYSAVTTEPILTIIFYAILIVSIIYAFRKNKYILFSIIYIGGFLGITFLTIQTVWDQDRLIIPVFSYMLLIVFWTFLQVSNHSNNSFLKLVAYVVPIIILGTTLNTTSTKIKENRRVLEASVSGNLYYGYTPDWQNYLEMCKVVGDEYADSTLVACRKPGMAFIHGKQLFYGISSVPTISEDSLFDDEAYYFAIPADDDTKLRAFSRDMIRGIFYGTAESERFVSNKTYFLFEAENLLDESLTENYIEAPDLQEHYNTLFLFSPDTMLNQLKNAGVDYIIRANLRAVPNQKTDRTITTVRRYMQIISLKYPTAFQKIYEVGSDEKAELFQIAYPNTLIN